MTLLTDSATARNLVQTLENARNELSDAEKTLADALPRLAELERLRRAVGRAKQTAYWAAARADKARAALQALASDTPHPNLREAILATLAADDAR